MAQAIGRDLAPSEWMVLYGLVRYPHLSDVELATELRVNPPVLSSIKNRLGEEGFFKRIRVPDWQRIGSELMTIWYGRFAPGSDIEQRRELTGDSGRIEELVHTETDGDLFYALLVGRNYTAVRRQIDTLERVYRRSGFFAEEETTRIQLPYELSIVVNYFDHSQLLAHEFGSNAVEGTQDAIRRVEAMMEEEPPNQAKLTKEERQALHALVKYPSRDDEYIAEYLDTSLESFQAIKNHLSSEELYRTKVIPNLGKLGYEVLSLTHSRFKPTVTIDQRVDPMGPLWEFPRTFMVLTQREDVMIAAHESMHDAREISRRLGEIYRLGFFKGAPTTLLFSIADMQSDKYHDYAPITRKLLGI